MLTYIVVPRSRQTPDNQKLHAKNIWEGRRHTGKCVFVDKRWSAVGESMWICNTDQCYNLYPHKGVGQAEILLSKTVHHDKA